MHSQDRILVLPVTTTGMSGIILRRIICIAFAIFTFSILQYGQCPPDMVDDSPPACLPDQVVTLNLDPGQCELGTSIPATLSPPAGMDNCDASPITSIITGPSATNPFTIGVYDIDYRVIDDSRNSQVCTFTLILEQAEPDNLNCTGSINHSLNPATCTGSLTLSDVLGTNVVSCPDDCVVTIMDEYGSPIPNDFDLDDLNKTYQYQLCCGGVCCWGYVTVQYYGAPTFICDPLAPPITSSCIEMDMIPPPIVTSQCVTPDVVLINQLETNPPCNSGIQKEIIRTYQIVTAQGPVNQTCEQTITVGPADLSNIVWPEKAVIGCMDEADPVMTGAPEYCVTFPAMGGQPAIDSCFALITDGLPINCSVFVSYEDSTFDTPCGEMISRLWHVVQWTCSVEEHETFLQIIEISDIEDPVLDCPSPLSFTTNTVNCEAAVTLPSINATDDCNNDLSYSISTPGGVLRENGGVVVLPVGMYNIVYRVSDCANTSECTVGVTVSDMTPPVAICESNLKIGFGEIGGTFLQAYKLDGGSYDDCSDVSFQIARMDDTLSVQDHLFADKILIECTDVDTSFMAILEVSDKLGNISYCMVPVCVTDKSEGQLICPPMATVDCDTIYDESNLSLFFGEYQITDNCPDRYRVQDILLDDFNDCGVGTIRRRIRLFNRSGDRIDQCIQMITFETPIPLDVSSLIIPADTIIEACTIPVDVLNIDLNLNTETCQLLGISTDIEELSIFQETDPPSSDAPCQQFLRTWKIIDWCIDDGPGSKADPFEFSQLITLRDRERPVFLDMPVDTILCNSSADCDSLMVTLPFPRVRDNCTARRELELSYQVSPSGDFVSFEMGETPVFEQKLEVGEHIIRYRVIDACGNVRTFDQQVEIKVCKAPTLSCLAGLVTPIPAQDIDGDGKPDDNFAIIETKQLVAAAFHPCGIDVQVSFSPTLPIQDTVQLSCSLEGAPYELELYAIDNLGNVSHCTSIISLSDNGLCPEVVNNNLVNVTGQIVTSSGKSIRAVDITLQGESNAYRSTNQYGDYSFKSMPKGGDYLIIPQKSDDFLNGVSMLDLILIQQHVLGLKKIADPYVLLAADINQTGNVNIADLIMLQRIILGSAVKPKNDQSWMFVDADYTFVDESKPFDLYMPHTSFINNLSAHTESNFIGVKYGDIDGNVLTNIDESQTRDVSTLPLLYTDMLIQNGQTYEISFLANDMIDIRGIQFEMDHESYVVKDISSKQIDLSEGLHITDESTILTMPVAEGVTIIEGVELFSMRIESNRTGWLSDLISMSKNVDPTVIMSENLEIASIDLIAKSEKSTSQLDLLHIKPNPWSDFSSIEYYLENESMVRITLTNVQGAILFSETAYRGAGLNSMMITNDILPHPGVYLIHIDNGNMTATEKMIKLE